MAMLQTPPLDPWPATARAILLLAAALHAAPAAAAGDAERGRALLARYHCGVCHTIPGVAAARGTLAVTLQAYGRRSYIAGRVANDAATLARWIEEPAALIPGTAMPDMGVTAADARDIAAYLGQLR